MVEVADKVEVKTKVAMKELSETAKKVASKVFQGAYPRMTKGMTYRKGTSHYDADLKQLLYAKKQRKEKVTQLKELNDKRIRINTVDTLIQETWYYQEGYLRQYVALVGEEITAFITVNFYEDVDTLLNENRKRVVKSLLRVRRY